jgi:hypothetical protein
MAVCAAAVSRVDGTSVGIEFSLKDLEGAVGRLCSKEGKVGVGERQGRRGGGRETHGWGSMALWRYAIQLGTTTVVALVKSSRGSDRGRLEREDSATWWSQPDEIYVVLLITVNVDKTMNYVNL